MKKRLSIMITALLAVMLILVSCGGPENDPETAVGMMSFSEGPANRALNRKETAVDLETLYWKYTAVKKSALDFTLGQVIEPQFIAMSGDAEKPAALAGLSNHVIGPMSIGKWEFTLYGYKDSSAEKLVYTGSVTATIEKKDNNRVIVNVSPLKTLEKGASGAAYIRINKGIGIKRSGADVISCNGYLANVKATNLEGTIEYDIEKNKNLSTKDVLLSVPSGDCLVTIEFFDSNTNLVVATGEIVVTKWDYIETQISGYVDENTGTAGFEAKKVKYETVGDKIKATNLPVPVDSAKVNEIPIATSPVDTKSKNGLGSKISLPCGALSESGDAVLSVTTSTVANQKFDAVSETKTVGSLDINLNVGGKEITSFNDQEIEVTTYIVKNLPSDSVSVLYQGVALDPSKVTYDPVTGLLKFKTNHLSEYDFAFTDDVNDSARKVVAINTTTGVAYTEKYAANKASGIGNLDEDLDEDRLNKIVIMNDFNFNSLWDFESVDVDIDLNGHTIVTKTLSFCDSVVKLYGDSKVTVHDGTIVAGAGTPCVFKLERKTSSEIPQLSINKVTMTHQAFETAGLSSDKPREAFVVINNDGIVDVSVSTLNSEDVNRYYPVIMTWGGDAVARPVVNLKNNTVKGSMYFPANTTVTIDGGSYENNCTVIYQKAGLLTINSGDFTSKKDSGWMHYGSGCLSTGDVIILEACDYPGGNPSFNIKKEANFTPATADNHGVVAVSWKGEVTDAGSTISYWKTTSAIAGTPDASIKDGKVTNMDKAINFRAGQNIVEVTYTEPTV